MDKRPTKVFWPEPARMLEIYFETLAQLVRDGVIPSKFRINLSDPAKQPSPRKLPPPVKRPSKRELDVVVTDAESAITFHGGTPTRPPVKRQQIDRASYSYGLLWGIACALDCSLKEVVERYSLQPRPKRSQRSRWYRT